MEQLANLYSTTLASPYTSGSGIIVVSNATGAPTQGTFSVTILDASTGAVILIFRVTSVSGTTFSGAAEGPDTNAAASSVVIGTMLTAAAITQIKADSFLQPLTPPISGNLTPINFNTGSCVTTQNNNSGPPATSITLTQSDPTNSLQIAGLTKAPINAHFTLTIGCSMVGYSTSVTDVTAGLWLTDGSSNNIAFILNSAAALEATYYNNFAGSYNSNVFASSVSLFPFGPLAWFRVQETASARNYYISPDGINFILLFTESNTAHFTTTQYGFMTESRTTGSASVSSICCYSMVETTP